MRLIDVDELRKSIEKDTCPVNISYFYRKMREAPTIDAVPVVRCKDCSNRYTEDCPMKYEWSEWCDGWGEYIDCDNDNTEDNYFCHKGERRNDD